MEELVPIVGKLAEKYTSFESTSISYEKAEQLMGAVLYSIHEWEAEEWEPAKTCPITEISIISQRFSAISL